MPRKLKPWRPYAKERPPLTERTKQLQALVATEMWSALIDEMQEFVEEHQRPAPNSVSELIGFASGAIVGKALQDFVSRIEQRTGEIRNGN